MKLAFLRRTVDSDAALFALVVGFSLAYLGLFIFRSPYDLADEGYLYYVVERLQKGDRPYLDVELHSYLPPMFGAFVAYAGVAGDSVVGFRALMAVGLSLAAGLGYLSLKDVVPRRTAVLLAIAMALVPGPFFKFYVRLLQLAVLAAALWWWRSRSRVAWIAFVIASAAGLVFRVDAFYAGLALCAAMLVAARMRKELTTVASLLRAGGWALGGAIAILLVRVYVGDAQVFSHYLRRLFGVVAIAAERTGSDVGLSLPRLSSLVSPNADTGNAWMAYGSIAALAVLAWALLLAVRRERLGTGTVELALVFGWVALNTPQYLLVRPDVYHATQQAFAFLLAAAMARSHFGSVNRRLAARVAGVAAAMLLVGIVVLHAQALRWSAGVLRLDMVHANPCGVPYVAYAGDRTAEMLEVACLKSEAAGTLEAMPFATGANHLTGRKRPSRHLFILAEDFSSASAQQAYLDEVARNPPAFVLYERSSTMNRAASGLLRNYAPLIDRYYEESWLPVVSQQGHTLMAHRSHEGGGDQARAARALRRAESLFARSDLVGGVGAAIDAMRAAPADLAPVVLLARQASGRKDAEVAAALWQKVFDESKRALRSDPSRQSALESQLIESAVGAGQGFLDQARYAAAEPIFRELAEVLPTSAQAELILGQVLRRSRGCAAARPRLAQALALDPTLEAARTELAACP